MPAAFRSNLLLCLSYAITGWLALQIAVPPGYAAPLFPPAGLALAALMIEGLAVLPAIFAGSLVVQLFAVLNTGIEGAAWIGLVLPPLGATLQAWAGLVLAQRLLGLPNPLDHPYVILRFIGLVAPLSCVISASFGLLSLLLMQAIPQHEATFTWVNWWAGDTLGVLVMTPLVLALFGRPAAEWRPRRLVVTVPMIVALALLAFTFYQVRNWENARVQAQFNRDAEHLASLVRKRLDAQLDQMLTLDRLAAVHPALDRQTWLEVTWPLLDRYPGTQNFGWSPLIPDSERDRFEARVRAQIHPDFHILGRDVNGQTHVAGRKAEYLPILFVEPFAQNRSVLGLDPLVLDKTAAAALRTRETGQPAISESIRLVQEQGEQRGVVIYQAVFRGRPVRQIGMISGVFRMDDAMNTTLPPLLRSLVDVCLSEETSSGQLQRLYGPSGCEATHWPGKRLAWQTVLPFAGRTWLMQVVASPAYTATLRSWGVWLTLASGLLCTGILGAFLLLTSSRARRIEALVTERTQQLAEASKRLRRQQRELVEAQRIARLGSWETDQGDPGVRASSGLRQLIALPAGTALTHDALLATVHRDDRSALAHALDEVSAGPTAVALDARLVGQDTPPRILHFRIESHRRPDGRLRIHGTAQDVSAARAAEAHIAHLAHYDPLTGLPNRTQWNERGQSELRAASRHGDLLALLFLDLDHFKSVNDSLGHAVGDQLLTIVARRFSQCLRENDFLARLGGDEFVVMLPRLSHREDAALVAQKLIATLREPVRIDNHDLTVSVSIGIALFPEDGNDVNTLLKHADTAMYGAKDEGRNTFHYFMPEMDGHALELLLLENALRRAIERDELVLHYQPQITRDGQLSGCEALVRWQHPERGLLPPGEFIGIAEKSGMILPLGEWVLREACRQQAAWAAAGHPLIMAVNISALQFRQGGFDALVRRIVEESGMDPCHLELELTESTLMQPTPEVLERMNHLRALGIRLALDDFGTGYSSLSHLKRLPIQRLKIDRSFVLDLPHDPDDVTIAAATLSLARDLGLEVVAEGVETPEQLAFLSERQCAVMQGYLFSRPLPAAEFSRWVAARPATSAAAPS